MTKPPNCQVAEPSVCASRMRTWLGMSPQLGVDHGERLGALRQCPLGTGRRVEGARQFGAGGPEGLWPSLSVKVSCLPLSFHI